jgi:hypothetical protein
MSEAFLTLLRGQRTLHEGAELIRIGMRTGMDSGMSAVAHEDS